ncbi:MAG: hypothetical protein D4S01_03835 [Dehalococcoidia bacterium]|nr:MAG: hypothetical protein D4S01_03835 [Dehalococcoidia bacterium]
MAIKVSSLINQAYQMIGVVDDDESANGTQNATGLLWLNQTLAQLNVNQLFPYSREVIEYPIQTPKLSYTLGDDESAPADILGARPAFINRVLFQCAGSALPYEVYNQDLPDLYAKRRSARAQGAPQYVAYNPKYPDGELLFDIAPQAGGSLIVIYNTEIPFIVSSNETLAIPAEYSMFLACSLGLALAVNNQVDASIKLGVMALRDEAEATIETSNGRNQIPTIDSFLNAGANIRRNVYTG